GRRSRCSTRPSATRKRARSGSIPATASDPLAVSRPPLADAFDALRPRRLILFGGKGGVGKTTIAIAAALHFSRSRSTILFTTDPASNLGDFFSANGEQPTANLTIESLDADELYQRFLSENLANFIELGDRGTYLDKD